jgi:hypothetical protein
VAKRSASELGPCRPPALRLKTRFF